MTINPRFIEQRYSFEDEPRIPTMDKKLAIEAAIPGWQPFWWWEKHGVKHLPPRTIEAQVDAIVECVKAGASTIHTHPRHPSDGLPRYHAPELLAEIMDRAFEKVDFITAHHTWTWDFAKSRKVDYIPYTRELLELGKGNKYVQTALIMTMAGGETLPEHTIDRIQEGVQYFEANDIKPMFSLEASHLHMMHRSVFANGIAKWKPFWVAIQMGKHQDDQIFRDPWSYIQVINNMSLVRELLPDSFIGVHPGGRNWLPAAVMGIMYGCELVRVGLEDQFYLYPHRDDISQKASDTVALIAKIARALGREIATVAEVRQRTGIRLTSAISENQ